MIVCDIIIGGVTNYWELHNTYPGLEYLYQIKHNKTGYGPTGRYYQRFFNFSNVGKMIA